MDILDLGYHKATRKIIALLKAPVENGYHVLVRPLHDRKNSSQAERVERSPKYLQAASS